MNMKNIIIIPAIVVFFFFSDNRLAAQDSTFTIGGYLQYDNVSYFNKQEGKINSRNEGLLQLTAGSGSGNRIQWKAIMELREDLSDENRNRIWLDELWMKQRVGIADITFGKQIIAWGTADGYNPVDNLNPVDYSDLLDTDDEIIGIYSIRTQLFFKSADIDFVWVPAGSYGKLPDISSRWFPPVNTLGIPQELLVSGMDISVKNYVPELTLESGEAAIRLRKRFSGFDAGLSYYNGYDHLPEYILDSTYLTQQEPKLVFDEVLYRQQVVGAEMVIVLPYGMSLRSEAAYFIPEKDKPYRNEYIQMITGIDKTFSVGTGSLTSIIEYIHDFRINGEPYAMLDTRHIFTNTLLTNFELTLNNGFSFNLVSIYNMDGNDYVLMPEINYLTTGGLKFIVMANILEGSNNTFMGSYSFNDRIQCKMSFSF